MDKVKKYLPFVGYALFYFVAFAFAAYLTFPYARLRDRLVAEFASEPKGKAGPQQRLEIDELEPYWLSGVRAKGVRVTLGAAPRPGGADDPPTVIEVDEVRARMSILPRLIGRTKVNFLVKAFGGEVEGTFLDSSTERHLEVDLDGVEITRIDPIVSMVGLPMTGSMKGKVDLTFPDKQFAKGSGTVALTIADLSVGNGVAKLKGMIALPKTRVGDLVLDAEAREGAMKLNKLAATGGDLEIASEGKIAMRNEVKDSLTDIYLRFKFSEAYKNKNDATKALFTGPLPAFELAPEIKASKRADGFFGWHMSGPFSNAKFDPWAGTGPAPAAPATPGVSPRVMPPRGMGNP
jgi:type II secretion system protein N